MSECHWCGEPLDEEASAEMYRDEPSLYCSDKCFHAATADDDTNPEPDLT